VKFVSITHSERNIWNVPTVATAISPEKRKPVLEGMVLQNPPIIYKHTVVLIPTMGYTSFETVTMSSILPELK